MPTQDQIPTISVGNSQFNATNISGNVTVVVKASAGTLQGIAINTKGLTNVCTIYDNASVAAGTKIAAIDTTLGLANLIYNIKFNNGLVVVLSGGTPADVTISWQ